MGNKTSWLFAMGVLPVLLMAFQNCGFAQPQEGAALSAPSILESRQNRFSVLATGGEAGPENLAPNQYRMAIRGRFLSEDDAWESKASARYFAVEYSAQNHDVNGSFNTAHTISNAGISDLEAKVRMRPFEPVQDIILKRINIVTQSLPTDVFDMVLGDTCLYTIGSSTFEPMPDGTHCTSTRTVSPASPRQRTGYTRNMVFPGETGLFVPAGSRINCPVHLAVGSGQTLKQSHVQESSVTCAFVYELAGNGATVQKFLRIPYLDEFRAGPDLILPGQPWYKAWSDTEPLVVRGLSMYWGPRHTAAESILSNEVCVYAIDALTRIKDSRKEICMPAQTIPAGTTFNQFNPSVLVAPVPFTIGPNERLSASCRVVTTRAKADCIVYPLIDVPAGRRASVRLAPIWKNPGYISMGFVRNTYCPELMNLDAGGITPAMLKILDSINRTIAPTVAPWQSISDWPAGLTAQRRKACTHLFDGY